MRSNEKKFQTIISKNTFYFHNPEFEEKYEGYINSVKETLLNLKNEIVTDGLRKEIISNLIVENEDGLAALLALTGLSNEFFKRLITVIRVVDDEKLSKLTYKSEWSQIKANKNVSEWGDSKIQTLIRTNESFRKGLVNIFFEGATIPFLRRTIPLFELKKLSISKLQFDENSLIDTLIRYKEKGSYSGNKENNAETVIAKLLNKLEMDFETGDLNELVNNEFDKKRTMDFIIPNRANPQIIIESSFLATTSSGQGDKAKTEISVAALIKKHYPDAKFIGFVDGIGWYVRKQDLQRMVTAFDDVFTFHETEMFRFSKMLNETLK